MTIYWGNLKVFIEETRLLHHLKLLLLFIFTNKRELLGVGGTQLVVRGHQVLHHHLGTQVKEEF